MSQRAGPQNFMERIFRSHQTQFQKSQKSNYIWLPRHFSLTGHKNLLVNDKNRYSLKLDYKLTY